MSYILRKYHSCIKCKDTNCLFKIKTYTDRKGKKRKTITKICKECWREIQRSRGRERWKKPGYQSWYYAYVKRPHIQIQRKKYHKKYYLKKQDREEYHEGI